MHAFVLTKNDDCKGFLQQFYFILVVKAIQFYYYLLHIISKQKDNKSINNLNLTRLPASRSSSVGPEGCFLFFHPKVEVKETISLTLFDIRYFLVHLT